MKTYIFKIKLLDNKKIVREIEVLEDASLYKLAGAIINAYDFDFDHAFGFFSAITTDWPALAKSEKMYELLPIWKTKELSRLAPKSVRKTKIGEVWKNIGDKMMMLFDYGDDWRFVVELIGFGKNNTKTKYPRVLKSVGDSPDQYPEYE